MLHQNKLPQKFENESGGTKICYQRVFQTTKAPTFEQ